MAIVGNILSEIQDSIVFSSKYPISGIESITGFTESVEGETVTRKFLREFRYTLDAVNFTDWIPLSQQALLEIDIENNFNFQVEFRYTRQGTDSTGDLIFNWVRLNYINSPGSILNHYFSRSIYSYFYDCSGHREIKEWCVNVLRKIYFPGIVPKSLTRGENRNRNGEDRDYIDFWSTVSCYFSVIVNYARSFSRVYSDKRLLRRYLEQQDIIVSRKQSLEELQYLSKNLLYQTSQRGTPHIASLNEGKPDGELIRLIEYDSRCDEFIFESATYIWHLDHHSPMYRGIHPDRAHKAYERGKEITLENYPLILPGKVEKILHNNEDAIRIGDVSSGQKAGIGFTDIDVLTEINKKFLFNVDPKLSYELSFLVKGSAAFTVGMYGYNAALTPNHPASINPISLGNYSIIKQRVPDNGEWYWVRVILNSFNEITTTEIGLRETSLGLGNNLRASQLLCKVGFEITLDRTSYTNQSPSVSNNEIDVFAGSDRVITLDDIDNNYQDVEGDPYVAIRINSITTSTTAKLYLDNIEITTFPTIITIEDIIEGKLVFRDTSPNNVDIDIDIDFTPLDTHTTSTSDGEFILIKNIKFKLLKREYGVGAITDLPLVETWMKNRSGQNNSTVNNKIRETLLPYNVTNHNNYL